MRAGGSSPPQHYADCLNYPQPACLCSPLCTRSLYITRRPGTYVPLAFAFVCTIWICIYIYLYIQISYIYIICIYNMYTYMYASIHRNAYAHDLLPFLYRLHMHSRATRANSCALGTYSMCGCMCGCGGGKAAHINIYTYKSVRMRGYVSSRSQDSSRGENWKRSYARARKTIARYIHEGGIMNWEVYAHIPHPRCWCCAACALSPANCRESIALFFSTVLRNSTS